MGRLPRFFNPGKPQQSSEITGLPSRPIYRYGIKLKEDEIELSGPQRQAAEYIKRAQERYAESGPDVGVSRRMVDRVMGLWGINLGVAYAPFDPETLPPESYVDISQEGEVREIMATREQLWASMKNKSVSQAADLIKGALSGRVKAASREMVQKAATGAAKTVAEQAAKKAAMTAVAGALGVATGGTSLAVQLAASFLIDKAGGIIKKAAPLIAMGAAAFSAFWAWLVSMGQMAVLGGLAGAVGFSLAGAALGTALIPIPIVGTLIGAGIGFVAGSIVGGLTGAYLGSLGATVSGIAQGIGGLFQGFTSGQLFAFSAPQTIIAAVGLGGAALAFGMVSAAFLSSPQPGLEDYGNPPVFDVQKSASPESFDTVMAKGDKITYTITVTSKDGQVIIDSVKQDSIKVYGAQGEVKAKLEKESGSDTNYVIVNNGQELKDVNIINTVSIEAHLAFDPTKKEINKGTAIVRVGNPPGKTPYGLPASGVVASLEDEQVVVNGLTRNHYGFINGRKIYGGIDIAATSGDIFSTMEGDVTYSSFDTDKMGGVLYVESTTREFLTAYLHLDNFDGKTDGKMLIVGTHVKRGDKIGRIYPEIVPGVTTGPHVHYQVLRGGANYFFRDHVGVKCSDNKGVNVISPTDWSAAGVHPQGRSYGIRDACQP